MIQTNGEKFIKFWAGTHGTIGIECIKLEKSNKTILRKRRYRRTHGPADWWLDKAEFKYLWVTFSSSEKKLSYLPMYILLSLQKKKNMKQISLYYLLHLLSYIFFCFLPKYKFHSPKSHDYKHTLLSWQTTHHFRRTSYQVILSPFLCL